MDGSSSFDRQSHAGPSPVRVAAFSSFRQDFQGELDATWRRMHDRHRDLIKAKRTNVILRNLEKIVTATLHISNQTSFHSMSLRDLSRHADVSMGVLYNYIESKEQLATMILGHVQFLVENTLSSPPSSAATARDRLRWLLRTHIYTSEIMQPWFFFAYMEAKTFDNRGRRMAIGSELRTERLIAECVGAGQAAGDFAPADPTMTASLVKPLLQDWYLKRWKYQRRGIDPDRYADWVVRFVETFLSTAGPDAGPG